MKFTYILLLVLTLNSYAAGSFNSAGSDLLMGVGAKNIASASASTANTDDIYAIFYNPAGLSEITSAQMSLSSQLDSTLDYINFLGIAYAFPINALDLKVAVAFGYIPRLLIKASGKYSENDFESIFVRYTLPGLSPDFDGNIDSKTDEYRFAMAFSRLHNPSWSLGVSAGYVNCATSFAGVTLEDPTNFTYISAVATTIAFGLGAKYYVNEDITLGVNMRNLDSQLLVQTQTTDNNGTSNKNYDVDIPYDFSVGASWNYDEDINLAADYQKIFGSYGNNDVDFQFLRLGTTINSNSLDYHLGLIVPIAISSANTDSPSLPFPVSPTMGLGWHQEFIDVSLAFYIHPIMSLHLKKPSPSLDLSLKYNF